MALRQLRAEIARKIGESPTTVSISRTPLVSDGMGSFVPDPYGVPVVTTETVRVSHEHTNVQDNLDSPVGLSTSLGLFLLARYDSTIVEGDTLDEESRSYKVGPVDTFERFGGAYLKQAPLTIVTPEEAGT